MENYKAETREILRRYSAGAITESQCIYAMDAAVTGLAPRLKPEELKILQAPMKSTTVAASVARDASVVSAK